MSDNTQGKNSKGGNKKQNSDHKSKQNHKSDTKRDRWCDYCKKKSHDTDYCWTKPKSQTKSIKKLDETIAENDSDEERNQNFKALI